MRNYLLFIFIVFAISSCKLISDAENCAEFHVKNELSSAVVLTLIQHIDSFNTFNLDTFIVAPHQTRTIYNNCSVGNVTAFPTGDFTKFTFANSKFKIDTFKNVSTYYTIDSINIYNPKKWTNDNSKSDLKVSTYSITAKDSLEAY